MLVSTESLISPCSAERTEKEDCGRGVLWAEVGRLETQVLEPSPRVVRNEDSVLKEGIKIK